MFGSVRNAVSRSRISRQKSDLELGNHLIDRNVIVLVRVLVGRFVKFGIGEESGIKINTVESTISRLSILFRGNLSGLYKVSF